MKITAKDIAKKLGLSATAVSMALNNKAGVSTETRKRVLEEAEKAGYDFSKHSQKASATGSIYIIYYIANNAILSYNPLFSEITEAIVQKAQLSNYKTKIQYFYEKTEDIQTFIEHLRISDCIGIILIGTEMTETFARYFEALKIPVVILDSYFKGVNCDCVLVDNFQGAYLATQHLIVRRKTTPGHLKSSIPIHNFQERNYGYQTALKENGMPVNNPHVHLITPTLEGAFCDMIELIEREESLADCYFADNDLIAIGAIKALKAKKIKVPEDVGIIGFDNISQSRIISPSLSTVNVPRNYMAQYATSCLISRIEHPSPVHVKMQLSTTLVTRFSV